MPALGLTSLASPAQHRLQLKLRKRSLPSDDQRIVREALELPSASSARRGLQVGPEDAQLPSSGSRLSDDKLG